MKERIKMITIFTPTYNRANLLPKLYKSLINQTSYEFEWLIVDDDSTDNTENVINEIIRKQNPFAIRYYKKNHGGKHRAINYALDLAEGEYFFIVDSDDFLKDEAVAFISEWVSTISDNLKIAGVSGLKVLPNGEPTSGQPNFKGESYIDASNFEREKYNLGGDQAEVFKTSILKKNRFPDFEGEDFLEEAVVWNGLAELGYVMRWYPIPIYCCEYLETGLTKTRNRWRIINNFYGYAEHYRLLIHHGTRDEYRDSFFYFWWASNKKKISLREKSKLLQMSKRQYILDSFKIIPFYGIKKVMEYIRNR